MLRLVACLFLAVFAFALIGCHKGLDESGKEHESVFSETEKMEKKNEDDPPEQDKPDNQHMGIPGVIEEWVDNSKDIFLGQSRYLDGWFYLLVTYGVKPTDGYAVEIVGIEEKEDRFVVTANFKSPSENDDVTKVTTYPYDLAIIETTPLPVDFVATGAEPYVPTLVGFPNSRPWELPEIVAGSENIKLFKPAPGVTVSSVFKLEGMANVFEGTVIYRLSNEKGSIIAEGITTGSMGDWGYISAEVNISDEINTLEMLLLELYTESAKDGSIENKVKIELFYE